jgi:hypothetical protein
MANEIGVEYSNALGLEIRINRIRQASKRSPVYNKANVNNLAFGQQ